MDSDENDDQIITIVQGLLTKAGDDLSSEPYDARYIRDIQGELRELALQAIDERIIFLLFFIPIFVDDIYYNLVGDIVGVSSEILEISRQEIFSFLGKSLKEMAVKLSLGDFDNLNQIYTKLVSFYIFKVNKLNSISIQKRNSSLEDWEKKKADSDQQSVK